MPRPGDRQVQILVAGTTPLEGAGTTRERYSLSGAGAAKDHEPELAGRSRPVDIILIITS
jgi:hypothetical protein